MHRLALLGVAALLGLTACPGTSSNFDQPERDAEQEPPDAALEVTLPPLPVRVVNWNVHNLYNDVRDSPEILVADEMILSSAEYQTKLNGISGVIATLGADIAVLEEVENQNVLHDLGEKLPELADRYITQGNDPRGIDIALLSRYPIERVVSHKQESFTSSATGASYGFARDVLEAHFTINGRMVIVLGIHFKSGTDAVSQDKRLAEAEQTHRIAAQLEAQDPSAEIVLLGDFNAVPGSQPLATLAGAPTPLSSVTAELPLADRYSVTYDNTPQLFDDQLVNQNAISALDRSTVKIDHGSAVNAMSDHDPVAATYMIE